MRYFDNSEEYNKRGIDYDLGACLTYNSQSNFDIDDIEKVLAVHEGANDSEDWRWILRLEDQSLYYLRGGCDYTGWDCVSWASSELLVSVESIEIYEDDKEVLEHLKNQIVNSKEVTWTEQKYAEFARETELLERITKLEERNFRLESLIRQLINFEIPTFVNFASLFNLKWDAFNESSHPQLIELREKLKSYKNILAE